MLDMIRKQFLIQKDDLIVNGGSFLSVYRSSGSHVYKKD